MTRLPTSNRLFDPERHEALHAARWDAGVVQEALDAIVADIVGAERDGLWPLHPLDEGTQPERTLYLGTAGVISGLSFLADEGRIARDVRWSQGAAELLDRYRAAPDTGSVVPSYFLGGAFLLLLVLRTEQRTKQRTEWANRLLSVVESNKQNPSLELLWGAPGTMLAAVFAHELTGSESWRGAFLRSASALMDAWEWHGGPGCHLWTQDLYGRQQCLLGAAHGFAGNVFALLRGGDLLPAAQRAAVLARAKQTLFATVVLDEQARGGCANWPAVVNGDMALVQWCHGAPGMLTSLGRAPADAELDELLIKGGELIWQAGPLRKGPNLCHGTAGNGAACLTLFARTGNVLWLERARAFAMHSIRQVQDAREKYGQGRYSLWTGDIGVAVYLWQCLNAKHGLLSLDF